MTELIYFATVFNTLGEWVTILSFFGISCCLITYWIRLDSAGEDEVEAINHRFKKGIKLAFSGMILGILLLSFVPDKKTMTVLATVYVIENTDGIENVTPNMVKLLNDYLEADEE